MKDEKTKLRSSLRDPHGGTGQNLQDGFLVHAQGHRGFEVFVFGHLREPGLRSFGFERRGKNNHSQTDPGPPEADHWLRIPLEWERRRSEVRERIGYLPELPYFSRQHTGRELLEYFRLPSRTSGKGTVRGSTMFWNWCGCARLRMRGLPAIPRECFSASASARRLSEIQNSSFAMNR